MADPKLDRTRKCDNYFVDYSSIHYNTQQIIILDSICLANKALSITSKYRPATERRKFLVFMNSASSDQSYQTAILENLNAVFMLMR